MLTTTLSPVHRSGDLITAKDSARSRSHIHLSVTLVEHTYIYIYVYIIASGIYTYMPSRGESNLREAKSGGSAAAGRTGPRRRVKKCEAARAAALSLSPSGGAAVGEALRTTRGHQGSGERTASSQSAAEPARRTIGTCVCRARSSVRLFVRLAYGSVRCRALRVFPLPSRSLRLPYLAAIGLTRIQWDLHAFFLFSPPETTDRLSVRPSVCSEVFHPGRKRSDHHGFRDPARKLRDYPYRFPVDSLLQQIVSYESGRDDDANLFCMVSTLRIIPHWPVTCSPVDDLYSRFEGTSGWEGGLCYCLERNRFFFSQHVLNTR